MDVASLSAPSPSTSATKSPSTPPMLRSTDAIDSASVADSTEPYANASLRSILRDAPYCPAPYRMPPIIIAAPAVPTTEKVRIVKNCEKKSFFRSEKPASKISSGSATRKNTSPLNTRLLGRFASVTVRRINAPSSMPASTAREDSGIHVVLRRCCTVSREEEITTPAMMVRSTMCVAREEPSSALGSRPPPPPLPTLLAVHTIFQNRKEGEREGKEEEEEEGPLPVGADLAL